MSQIFPGRYTAQHDGPLVVFLIGMRVNKLWAFSKWWPVAMAMGPMIEALYRHPEKGFLGGRTLIEWPGVTMIQYWRSFEDLEQFAKNPSDPHLGAWQRFNQAIGADGTVGIWHETFAVEAGKFESVYGNMPRTGLAAATGHGPITRGRNSARERMRTETSAPVEEFTAQ
ncbi:MAG: DUF4188 domain-containing protein [Roseiflexaceae bacterium]|nr:DUF4188 domain-containing protein [Roseiflexaceae bacterium]